MVKQTKRKKKKVQKTKSQEITEQESVRIIAEMFSDLQKLRQTKWVNVPPYLIFTVLDWTKLCLFQECYERFKRSMEEREACAAYA